MFKTFPRISKVHPDPKDGQATLTVGVVKKKLTAHVQSEASEMGQVKNIRRTGHCRPMRSQYFSRWPIRVLGESPSASHPRHDDGDHYAKLL